MKIYPQDNELTGRAWSVYISGKVNETTTHWATAPTFKVQVVPSVVFKVKNDPPEMTNQVSDLAVDALVDRNYLIGLCFDRQLDSYYLSDFNFGTLIKTSIPTWISFKNSTDLDLN